MWLVVFAVGLLLAAHATDGTPASEDEKIKTLISRIESLSEAKFVRNGTAYDAKTAGQFLRAKWDSQKSEIRSARDFIEKVASKSSTTGKPYLIRQPDGREIESSEYLSGELKKLETKP
jgi:hypothetical protein